MSEEVALAAGDLAYWQRRAEQADAEVKALRSLEQLDQALGAMSVTEIDSARARIDSALVPQLARMLALCLVKEDGAFYNVVTWALGSAEPLGTMELILQRTEGKTPTQLRIEAEADAAALKEALEERHTCANCGGKGSYWTDVGGEAEHEVCDCYLRADHVLYHEEHPGAPLLAELGLARALSAYLNDRTHWTAGICPTCGFGRKLDSSEFHGSGCVLAAYNEAMKARME